MGTPGGYEDESKKKAAPENEWAQLPQGMPAPTFGRTQRPALPDVAHPTHPSEHASYHMDTKQVDEEPLDWRNYVHATDPGNALPIRDLRVGGVPEAPNAHQGRFDPMVREMSWRAFGEAAETVDSMQQSIAPDYAAFMDAKNNADLQALGFVIPAGTDVVDASAFADQQHVSGGTAMGSLFHKDGSLNATKKDRAGMDTAQHAFDNNGAAKPAHDLTVSSDHELQAALAAFEGQTHTVESKRQKVVNAKLGIERVTLSHRVEADRENVEKLKKHAEAVQKSLEFVVGGALKYMVAGPEEAVDALEGIGTMASFAVSKVSGHSIDAAEAQLEKDTEKLNDTETEQARRDFETAKEESKAELDVLRSKREKVLEILGTRKQAYEAAGHASARASSGDPNTREKITAFMAAIPAAEMLVGMVRSMSAKLAIPGPRYSPTAGTGFAMAVYAGDPQATNMVSALGNMEFVKGRFHQLQHQWEARLSSLQTARTQLGGQRAELTGENLANEVEQKAADAAKGE